MSGAHRIGAADLERTTGRRDQVMFDSRRWSRALGPWIGLLFVLQAVTACSIASSAPLSAQPTATAAVSPVAVSPAASTAAVAGASPSAGGSSSIPARLIVFNLKVGDVTSMNIASVRTDDSDFRRLTNDPVTFYKSPAWDSANRRLLYADEEPTLGNIYWMSVDGLYREQMTSTTLFDDNPSISPDGRALAFDRGSDAVTSAIWVMHPNGPGETRLTRPPKGAGEGDLQPSISPDVTEIVFVRNGAVDVVGIDGGNVRELVPASYQAEHPHWSPDGRQIAFGNTVDGSAFLLEVAGSAKPRKIDVPGWLLFQPSFSPDGHWLVATFFFKESGYSGIGVMPVDGAAPTMVHVMDSDAEVALAPIWIP
jgi:Tol biopolymer transport system component